MANIKISELTALTPPAAADELVVIDVSATSTKKTTVGEVVGIIAGDVEVASNGTATISELPVSKLQDGAARQLLQTDAAGTGVEWTSNVALPGTLGVTGQSTLASAAVSDLTSGRVVLAGVSGELQDSANLTFNGTQLDIGGNVFVTGALIFEGSTADNFETTLTVSNPTADQTLTLPDVSGTVVTTGDTGSVTSAMLLDGTIVNVDINAAAAIAGTKISPDFGSQTITTTGIVSAALGAAATPSITFTGDTNTGIYSPGADQVAISTGGTGRLFVDASGRVGVGRTPVAYGSYNVLDLAGSAGAIQKWVHTGSSVELQTYASATLTAIGSATNHPFVVTTNDQERLRITSAGLVGVGTSSPSELLTVGGATANIGIFNSVLGSNASPSSSKINFYGFSQTANGNIASISAINTQQNTFGGVLQFATNTALGAHTIALTIDSSQRVGIGITSPATLLDVNGDVTIADKIIHGGDTNTAIRFPAADVFSVETAGSERLRIDSAGVLQIADAGNITVGTTTGTKIGTATTQKLGFYNATPVVQPAAVADATTAVDVITQLNDLLAKLRTLGIIAT